MPQMMPINWLILFMIFILTYLMFNIMNYFIYKPSIKTTKNKKFNTNILNWKW